MQKIHRVLLILAIGVAGLMSATAWAEVKIAFVDVQRAILSSEQAKAYMQQIQDETKSEQDEIRNLQTDAAALLERLQKDAEVMSDPEKRKLQQQIEDKNNDYRYLAQKLQKQIEERQGELFAGIDVKVQKAIEELVLSDDYDVIFRREAALYVGPLYDISRKLTEKLNSLDKPKAEAKAK